MFRIRCKRWITHALVSRVEDTINQYLRTKVELEHLKKHKVESVIYAALNMAILLCMLLSGADFLRSLSLRLLQANIKRVSKDECAGVVSAGFPLLIHLQDRTPVLHTKE